MKHSVFLDTNVILDFLTDREPFSENAAKIFSLSETRRIDAYISPLSFSDCYYILRKFVSHDKVIKKLQQLLTIAEITSITKKTITTALNSGFNDFEDAIQNYSAIEWEKIDIILTRNIKDFRKSEIAVMTPDTYLKTFSTGT